MAEHIIELRDANTGEVILRTACVLEELVAKREPISLGADVNGWEAFAHGPESWQVVAVSTGKPEILNIKQSEAK